MNSKFNMRIILVLTAVTLLSSCALNGIFLHPYKLHQEDKFSQFVAEKNDTLTLSFIEETQPVIHTSKGEGIQLNYSITSLFYLNSAGNNINAWLLKPHDYYNGTTIYFLHGNAGHLVYQYAFVTPFVKAGYQVFMIDYSGFGFSEGKATRKAVFQDAADGLDFLIHHPTIQFDKLLMYGQSLGGHLATVIANENQDKIDGLIIEGAFSSHKDIAAESVPLLGRIFTKEIYSAEKNISEYKKPLLIIHSTEDETIPFSHGESLFSLANEPKEFYVIDQPHIQGPLFYSDSIVAKMNRMLGD